MRKNNFEVVKRTLSNFVKQCLDAGCYFAELSDIEKDVKFQNYSPFDSVCLNNGNNNYYILRIEEEPYYIKKYNIVSYMVMYDNILQKYTAGTGYIRESFYKFLFKNRNNGDDIFEYYTNNEKEYKDIKEKIYNRAWKSDLYYWESYKDSLEIRKVDLIRYPRLKQKALWIIKRNCKGCKNKGTADIIRVLLVRDIRNNNKIIGYIISYKRGQSKGCYFSNNYIK